MNVKCTYDKLSKDISFVNPYNFVNVDFSQKAVADIEEIKEKERLTGVIHCTITSKTPIAIPDTEKEQPKNEHKEYEFMKDPYGRHFIPASSIRGMIRSVFETASDSCFSTVRDNTLLDARLDAKEAPDVKAGILVRENGKWKLYAAERYMLKAVKGGKPGNKNIEAWDDERCKPYVPEVDSLGHFIEIKGKKIRDGEPVRFSRLLDGSKKEILYKSKKNFSCAPVVKRVFLYDDPKAANLSKGYLVIGEPIRNKHHSSVFKADIETQSPINYRQDIIDRAFDGLKRTVDVYNDPAVNRNLKQDRRNEEEQEQNNTNIHYGYSAFERMVKKGILPVWYLTKGDLLYFMMANIGRLTYSKSLNDHLNKKAPCRKREELCPACRLFGMAGDTGNSLGSRIRFTDAICMTEEKISLEKTMLAELAKPRTSYMPFYSNVSEGDYRNRNNPGYDSSGVTIRGRKYYWHSTNFEEINKNKKVSKSERNSSMQLAESGSIFKFDVYFDSILEKDELRQLVWALNFFENKSDGNMCHKIGHGKPIGLGSIKITVDGIEKRVFDDKGYRVEPYKMNYKVNPFAESQSLKQLQAIVDFRNCQDVSYPYVKPDAETEIAVKKANDDNALANHRWFTENKSGGQRGHNHEIQFLPTISGLNDKKDHKNVNRTQKTGSRNKSDAVEINDQWLYVYLAELEKKKT